MRYCLNLPIGGPAADPRTLAEFAVAAEEAGWDACITPGPIRIGAA